MGRFNNAIFFLKDLLPKRKAAAENLKDEPPSWISGVYICAQASTIVLLLNIAIVAIASARSTEYSAKATFLSSSVVYHGNCTVSKHWDVALHLIVNILSTGILAASNYCMQTLVAPTREEVDAQHAQHQWLDVGSSSLRNIVRSGRYRLILWIILLTTATPFHLLYNSMFFQAFGTNELALIVGPEDLDSTNIQELTSLGLKQCFNTSTPPFGSKFTWEKFSSDIAQVKFERLNLHECSMLLNCPESGIAALVLLAHNLTVKDGGDQSMLLPMKNITWADDTSQLGAVSAAPFSNYSGGNQSDRTICNHAHIGSPSQPSLEARSYEFSECLGIKVESICQLRYSPTIGIIVTLSMLAKVISMFLAAKVNRSRSPPLLTVGDAVASFLERPDPMTTGLCWLSKSDVQRGYWKYPLKTSKPTEVSESSSDVIFSPLSRSKFWIQVPNLWQWFLAIFFCWACIALGLFQLFYHREMSPFGLEQIKRLWSSGMEDFGKGFSAINFRDTASTGLDLPTNMQPLYALVLANIPQFFVTISYTSYNSVLTSMLAAAEYSSYGTRRKPLRVTWRTKNSDQRSTYWLSVPYQYGIPILVVYAALHWLMSQGFYFTWLLPYDNYGNLLKDRRQSTLSVTLLPIFLAVIVLGLLLCFLFVIAFRKLKSDIPLAETCSAAISAACHPPKDENLDTIAMGPVTWGETREPEWMYDSDQFDEAEDRKGHCSFTSARTSRPSLTKLYA
ncbi:hypothetical protein N7532_008522 [Penicillium argentinense]|uniref:DUF6536 domain-containing protein n=1 Tax=Penicillium argentinense TaxID=1131581 RepID=A0A9W9EXI7_9EURO|nr:uncharacterized protein N7532_008522 [Penicillium argentinense]KAJ5089838.1 hypothetical protein N7532_008522 [Penicillium argentinense]